MGKEKKSPKKSQQSDQPVPNLDDLISSITNNGNFKTMMDSISGGLQDPNLPDQNESKSNVDEDNEIEVNDQENNILPEIEDITANPQFDIMNTFLTDNQGNNIAEILSNINNNLSLIVTHLTKS